MYRVSSNSVVKPYPVFDANGNPCGVRNPDATIDASSYAALPPSFVGCKIASYAGVDGNLEFVDFVSDYADYMDASGNLRTPFQYLIASLRSMLPGQNGAPPKDGKPTPAKLLQIQKNIGYSSDSIIFRAAVQVSNGKTSNSKNATNGILFTTFFYVPQKSARTNLLKLLNTRFDNRQPLSEDNCMLSGMYSVAQGCSIGFFKTGVATSDPHDVKRVDPIVADNQQTQQQWMQMQTSLQQAVGMAFNAFDDATYFARLREKFGAFQNVEDALNVMTAQEMVNMLFDFYPASWVWYGLKDSPYAPLVPENKKIEAFQDPEMACRFGVVAETVPTITAAPAQPQAFAQPQTFAQPTNTLVNKQPVFNQQPQMPMNPAPQVSMPTQSFNQAPAQPQSFAQVQYQEPDAIPMGDTTTPQPSAADDLFARLNGKYGTR